MSDLQSGDIAGALATKKTDSPHRPESKKGGDLAGIARAPGQAVVAVILAFSVFHLILAATVGLGVDECYDISVSHDLKLSYFDHPPLSYWIAHFFMPVFGDGRALRVPFIAIFAGTSWFLYLLTRQLFGATAGFWSVLALNLSVFFTFAGGWVLPDGPLLFCLVAAAYTISRALFPVPADSKPASLWRTWIVAGLWIGLAGLSKYHAVLFAAGLLVFFMSSPSARRLLRHPAPWIGAAFALAVFAPVIVWNAKHHWASFAFQGARLRGYGNFPVIGGFLANLGGQILWLAPWIAVPIVIATYQAARCGKAAERSWYCVCLGLPAVLLFTIVPLWGDRGFPHWQMPGWLMLFPVLGDYLARKAALARWPRRWAFTSAALLAAVAVLVVAHAATGFGRMLFPTVFAKGDPSLEALEWTPLRNELQRRGLLDKPGLFVISGNAIDIGKIDQALGDSMPMMVFGVGKQYAFRFDPQTLLGRDALIIGRRDRMDGIDRALAPYFVSIEEQPAFTFGRSGMSEVDVRILYGRVLKQPIPLH